MKRIFGALGLLIALAGCHPGEGERCNPLLFNDECTGGLKCIYPTNCGVAYCCPPPELMSAASGNCQACPDLDAGTD
jgi:hypothetical protein